MAERIDRTSLEDLEELRELMELADEPEQKIRKVLRYAKQNPEFCQDRIDDYMRIIEVPGQYRPYPDYRGELTLGRNPDGHPVGISRRQLNEHMLVTGRTGAGKTTFFYNLMDTLNAKDVPFLVFDFKEDYRDVAADLDLSVVDWESLKFNPLQPPPGVSDARWAEAVAQTWAHSMGFMTLSKSYFLNKLQRLYGLYRDETVDGRYPSLFELRDLVDADDDIPYASPRFRARERTLGRTEMLTGFSGTLFDCSAGHPVDELLERNVVIELQEPVREVQQFVIESLLTWIFLYREAQDEGRGAGLRHAVLFDEAKMVFDRQREEDGDVPHPPVTGLMGRIRAFGEGLVVADHEPSKLSDSVKANTNVKLWMSLGSGKDTGEMADTFGVDGEEVDFTRTLERGEAVLTTAEKDPVPVRLPPYTADPEAGEPVPVLDELGYGDRVRPNRFLKEIGEFDGSDTDESTDDVSEDIVEETRDSDVGEVAERLLASVNDRPFLSMSARYDAVDVGRKTGNRAKDELRTLGLVRQVEIDSRKPGRNPELLELTDQGEQVLEERGYSVAGAGRRGIRHRYWQQQVKDYYEADGYDAEIEYAVDDGHIDVYAEQGGESVAVEVATSAGYETENVRKCLLAGVDRVEVACLEDGVRERIEAAVREEFGGVPDGVRFVDVAEYA